MNVRQIISRSSKHHNANITIKSSREQEHGSINVRQISIRSSKHHNANITIVRSQSSLETGRH